MIMQARAILLTLSILLVTPLHALPQQPNAQQPTSDLCGNGVLDPGEQCDPLDIKNTSAECCSSTCQRLPRNTLCSGGLGVCSEGKCLSRSQQCSAYDGTLMQFAAPGGVSAGTTSIQGPFTVCYVSADSASSDSADSNLSDVVQSKVTAKVSMLSQLLPPSYQRQASCSLACQGQVVGNSSNFCVEFGRYTNLAGSKSVQDNLPCVLDNSIMVNLAREVDKVDVSDPAAFTSILTPGVCVTGACKSDVCRTSRCGGNGNCVLAAGAVSSIAKSLGMKLNQNASAASNDDNSALVQCHCDEGWTGTMCQTAGDGSGKSMDDAPVFFFNVKASTDGIPGVSGRMYNQAIIASVLGTFFGSLFLMGMILFLMRRREKGGNSKKASDGKPRNDPYSKPVDYRSPPAFDASTAAPTPVSDRNGAISANSSFNAYRAMPPSNMPTALKPAAAGAAAAATGLAAATATSAVAKTPASGLPSNYLRAAHAYNPRLADEIQLLPGDILYLIKAYDDGWAKAYNLRTGKEGIFPLSFAKRVTDEDAKKMPASSETLPFQQQDPPLDDDAMSDRADSLGDRDD